MRLGVLYEDNHLIAVYKPAGILVQGDKTGEANLMDEVKNFLKEKYNKPGKVFLGLLHRLDRPVSGIVLFAKTSKGASRLSQQFRNHVIEKIYHALVEGKPKREEGRLINYLKKDRQKNVVSVFDQDVPGSQKAILRYEVVKTGKNDTLLRITLETGRPHQIRVQLSHIGHPIVGDVKYGASKSLPDKSIALCATSLSFTTATIKEKIEIKIEIPFNV